VSSSSNNNLALVHGGRRRVARGGGGGAWRGRRGQAHPRPGALVVPQRGTYVQEQAIKQQQPFRIVLVS